MTFWRWGVFDLTFHFPHHRLLTTPFSHSLVFASVPLSHIHHFYKFHPNVISRHIVCDRQKNKWANKWICVGTDIFCTILKKIILEKMSRFGIFCKDTVMVWFSTVCMAAAESLNHIRPVISIRNLLLRTSAFICWRAQLLPFHFILWNTIHSLKMGKRSLLDTATSLSYTGLFSLALHCRIWRASVGLSLLMEGYKVTGKQWEALIIRGKQPLPWLLMDDVLTQLWCYYFVLYLSK